jgi:hypothetical protein
MLTFSASDNTYYVVDASQVWNGFGHVSVRRVLECPQGPQIDGMVGKIA